jgi:uncharacterized protein DUF3806
MKQDLKPITEKERAWIEARLNEARAFVDTHSPGDAGQPFGIDAMDRALAGWVNLGETEPEKVAAAVDVVAVTFGRFLERSLDFSWVMVTGVQSSELALHGLPGRGDVLIFPQDLVGKRCRKGAKNFLKTTIQQISQHVGSLGGASRKFTEH